MLQGLCLRWEFKSQSKVTRKEKAQAHLSETTCLGIHHKYKKVSLKMRMSLRMTKTCMNRMGLPLSLDSQVLTSIGASRTHSWRYNQGTYPLKNKIIIQGLRILKIQTTLSNILCLSTKLSILRISLTFSKE